MHIVVPRLGCALVLVASAAASLPALAGTATWGNWTSSTPTTVSGNIGAVGVTYTGGRSFAQLNNTGTYYWTQPNPLLKPYESATVSNAPADKDIVALNNLGGTVTFASPVKNPVMGIVSLGQPGLTTTWTFDKDFAILSQGRGYWGGTATSMSRTGVGVLRSNEGHGVIQFVGTFSSLSWSISNGENWAGFTLGLVDNVIPLPSAAGMSLAGLGLLAVRRRRHIR